MSTKNDLRRARFTYDYRVAIAMAQSSSLIDVRAFASQHDLKHRHQPVSATSKGHEAGYYLVHYHVKSLVGRGKFNTGFEVVFDLVSKKSYPEKRADNGIEAGGISATCVSTPIPWSPHFLAGSGTICLGSIWRGAKHTLLAHVIIHVARLLNWDEPYDDPDSGWNPDAVRWWKKHLHARPITPGLRYPSLPAELTHGGAADSSAGSPNLATNRQPRGFQIIDVGGAPAEKPAFTIRSTGTLT